MSSAALPSAFYARPVLEVARDLLGCVLSFGGGAGVIVETEAYHDSEAACHAHVGLTPRTHVLFGPPGRAYVYRSYGVHALFNAVAEAEGVGAAVLVRALAPTEGLEAMRARRGRDGLEELCSGPGKLTQALGMDLAQNATDLATGPVSITPPPAGSEVPEPLVGPRVGITRAVELPWRFCLPGERSVSKPWPPGLRSTVPPRG